jgi:hypothetical protein
MDLGSINIFRYFPVLQRMRHVKNLRDSEGKKSPVLQQQIKVSLTDDCG